MHARPKDEETIFCEALDCPSAEARNAFLQDACRGDDDLRRRVDALLRARESHESFLAQPVAWGGIAAADPAPPSVDASGDVIGAYKLLERIGEGGFGSVYMAEQTEPVNRRVALKVIKPGMDSVQVIARFEAERQALAMMDHPNIARVLDAGATDARSPLGAGRPYFVMELVRGIPITTYSDADNLTIRERLDLFTDVCHAVQHAHQKGVIHRDIKPTNVLVTLHDDRPVPKVIDFGVAKATHGRLTDKTLFTEFRQLIGTPAYMSPEQAGVSDLDVDTRSDVYSLGVLLYELLTGTTPFEPARLHGADFDEMRRIIREEEPPRPSTRVSRLLSMPQARAGGLTPPDGGSAASIASSPSSAAIAGARDTDPKSLVRSLSGDLDWIVMKCLEKDRERRYETANALAQEVERYLKNEPVLAGPPSRAYRFRKFVRRNRVMVTAGAIVAGALLAGIGGTTYGLVRAEERRAEAEAARKQTQQVSDFQAAMLSGIDAEKMGVGIKDRLGAQVRAALERGYVGQGADRRKRTQEEIDAEMAAFGRLAGAAHSVDVARQVMDEFVLAPAAVAMQEQFADQPLVRARLHFAIGKAYHELGWFDAAEPHLRAALELRRAHYGPETANHDVAECLYDLGSLMGDKSKLPEEEKLLREALAMFIALYGEDHQMVARTLDNLGGSLMAQGNLDEAEKSLNDALRLNRAHCDEDDPDVIGNLADLATLYWKKGEYKRSEELHLQVLEKRRRLLGDRDPSVGLTLFNLAQAIAKQDRHPEAEERFGEALSVLRAVHGEQHPWVAKTMYNQGVQVAKQGRRDEAEELFRKALDQQRPLLGDHFDTRNTLGDLAGLRQQAGDFDEAVALLRESLEIAERMYPDGHPDAWRRFSAMGRLATVLSSQARAVLPTDRERALTLYGESVPLMWDGYIGRAEGLRNVDHETRRATLERTIKVIESWHKHAPERGWDEWAARWRAELENFPGQ